MINKIFYRIFNKIGRIPITWFKTITIIKFKFSDQFNSLFTWKINKVITVRKNPNYWDASKVKLNKINFIPDILQELRNLKILDLEETQLFDFPEIICNLPHLEELNLFKNNSLKFFDDFYHLFTMGYAHLPFSLSDIENFDIVGFELSPRAISLTGFARTRRGKCYHFKRKFFTGFKKSQKIKVQRSIRYDEVSGLRC